MIDTVHVTSNNRILYEETCNTVQSEVPLTTYEYNEFY